MRHTAALAALAPLALALSGGCQEQLGDIDRTQPDKVDKSHFDGEFYYLQTVVDVPYTAPFTIIGEQQDDPMDRVVWDIQEKYLYARRAREFVIGERDGDVGAPLAAFAIDSHFDVQREYDSTTGEQTNVLVENDTDRPWYERAYMRVNWATNYVDDHGAFYAFSIASDSVVDISDHAGDEAFGDPNRTQVTRDYIETTQSLTVDAPAECYDYNDDWVISDEECEPACWWSYTADCVGRRIQVRHSFMRTGERDYVARHYDDFDMERFGYFRSERFVYDRERALTDTGRLYWQQRWNIWTGSLTDTPCEEDLTCGEAPGQVCDPIKKVCAKAYTERGIRPVTYYLSAGFPAEFRDSAMHLAAEWNQAMQTTVNHTKFGGQRRVTCLPGQDAADDCCTVEQAGRGDAACVPDVFVLKDNDCSVENIGRWAADPELRDLLNDRLGGTPTELDHLQRACAGFAQHTATRNDPNRRFQWQRLGDLRWSMLYWVDGPNDENPLGYGPSAADPVTGELIQASALVYGNTIAEYSAHSVDVVRVLNGELAEDDVVSGQHIRDHIEGQGSAAQARERRARVPADERARRVHQAAHPHGERANRGAQGRHDARRSKTPNMSRTELARLRERIAGTAFEAKMIPDHQRLLLGRTPADLGDPLSRADQAALSPVTGRARRRAKLAQRRQRRAMKKNMYRREFADGSVIGYAHTLKGVDAQTMQGIIANLVFTSTTEHEVGHTLGLRHNFAGSADPLNYFPKYWELRGAEPEPFTDGFEYSEEQREQQMPMFQYSAIMDYGARFHSDIKGLGSYDKAAIAYGYGDLVERFPNLPARITGRFGDDGDVGTVLEGFHYTDFPELFGGSTAALFEREWLPAGTDVRQEVPYKFCSDEYEGALWDCDIWDRGADPYEIARYAADAYRQYYVFEAFRRDNYWFNVWDYQWRMYSRYFLLLMKLYQHWYFYDDGTEEWATDPDTGQPLTLATYEALNLFWEVLTTPDRGSFCWDPGLELDPSIGDEQWYSARTWAFWGIECGDDESSVPVPLGAGRPSDVLFDPDLGYYWWDKVQTAGSYYDKTAVMDAMSFPEQAFIGVDDTSNADSLTFTLFDGFPNEMIRLFGGMMAERPDWYAGRFVLTEGEYVYTQYDPLADGGGDAQFQDPDSSPAFPEVDFNLQNYAAWTAMPYFTFGWDQRFNDASRIYIKGSAEDATPADPAREVTFADPFSGRIYAALRYDDRFVSPAWQLVTDMATLGAAWQAANEEDREFYEGLLRYKIDLADTYRGLYDYFGKST